MNIVLRAFLTAILKTGGELLLALASERIATFVVRELALWSLDVLDRYAKTTPNPVDDRLITMLRTEVEGRIIVPAKPVTK